MKKRTEIKPTKYDPADYMILQIMIL